mmetsp:Transcript_15113/g.45266  ORF Transcript_15113/g.45266 Transcript_15113/m.45266 type:complete len:220 (-) Transcript_15113:903-1562(-)
MSASTNFNGSSDTVTSGPSRASITLTTPSPVTSPTKSTWQRSRAATASRKAFASGLTNTALDSWYSAPQSSTADSVGSPTVNLPRSYAAPSVSTISLSTLPFPPQPWSWIDTMGFAAPRSAHARTTRFMRLSICASPRWTASKSSAAFSPLWTRDDAAPPPMPMRYAGPPTLATSMPFSAGFFAQCLASSHPTPAENMTGFSHSQRSPRPSSARPSERQ